MTYNYPRIGGVRNDVPANFERDFTRVLNHFEKRLTDYEALCDQSTVFRMRMEDVGNLTAEQAMNLGVTGPNLRGSGVDYDIRRDDPYEVVRRRWTGTCASRRKATPTPATGSGWTRCGSPARSSGSASRRCPSRAPIRVKPPRNAPRARRAWAHIEDPRGEAFMYIIGNGDDRPYRLKVRSPIFVTVRRRPDAHGLQGRGRARDHGIGGHVPRGDGQVI